MSEKRNKYDTDPLDPEFARQTETLVGATGNVEGEAATRHLPADEAATTRHLDNDAAHTTATPAAPARQEAEAPTRRIDGTRTSAFAEPPPPPLYDPSLSQPYPSVFAPTAYQPPATGNYNQTGAPPPPLNAPFAGGGNAPSSRTVAGINLPEKYALVLPYVPYIGVVAALIELLLVPRRETRVRFHAAQGLALHAAIYAISWALTFVGFIARGGRIGATLFSVAAFVFLIVSALRVWKGEDHRLAPLADATKWLNARLEPHK